MNYCFVTFPLIALIIHVPYLEATRSDLHHHAGLDRQTGTRGHGSAGQRVNNLGRVRSGRAGQCVRPVVWLGFVSCNTCIYRSTFGSEWHLLRRRPASKKILFCQQFVTLQVYTFWMFLPQLWLKTSPILIARLSWPGGWFKYQDAVQVI